MAVDPLTARITLTQPDARILSAYVPILPKHIWGKIPKDDLTKFNPCCPMIGSGPFIVTKLDRKGTSILEPNPYFYGPKGSIQRILMTKYQDKEAQLRDIKLNRLDAILQADSEWIKSVDDPELTVWGAAYVGFKELAFNSCPPEGSPTCTGPGPDVAVAVVQDPAIRLALAWGHRQGQPRPHGVRRRGTARDRNHLAVLRRQGLLHDHGRGRASDTPSIRRRRRRSSPTVAGHVRRGGTCEKDGVKAEFTLIARSSSREDQNAANRIRAWANELGIKINLSIITDDALNSQIYNPTSSTKKADADKYEPTYDAFIWGWFGDLGRPTTTSRS